jgi:hypothetical protein
VSGFEPSFIVSITRAVALKVVQEDEGTQAVLECLEGIIELGTEVPIYGGE